MRASEFPAPGVYPSVTVSAGIILPETVLETGDARLIQVNPGVRVIPCDTMGEYRDPLVRRIASVLGASGKDQFDTPETFFVSSCPEGPLYLRVIGPGRVHQ